MLQLLIDRCSLKIATFTKSRSTAVYWFARLLNLVRVTSCFSQKEFSSRDASHFSETKSTCDLLQQQKISKDHATISYLP